VGVATSRRGAEQRQAAAGLPHAINIYGRNDAGLANWSPWTGWTGVVEIQLAGCSGFGEPRQRAPRDRDVANGYVSAEAAAQEYGRQVSAA
jgi:hypothetical protein